MESSNLPQIVAELLQRARATTSGRSAQTLHGGTGNVLRQTVVALAADHQLSEHDSPDEATLQVLQGRVRLVAGHQSVEAHAGSYLVIPAERHSLHALEDSAVLLTVTISPSR